MERLRHTSPRRRAAVAVVALYGLLLQAFLAAALPLPAAGLDGLHAICAPSGDAGAPDGQPASAHRHDGCCILCAAPTSASLPDATALPARSVEAAEAALGRSAATAILPTGPPTRSTSPRGPPAA